MACGEVFLGAGGFASGEAFGHQKAVRRDAQRRVMVEAAPTSSFVMAEPQFLFTLLVVAFNAPTPMSLGAQFIERRVFGASRQIIFEGLDIVRRPLDQQPLRRV